MSGCWRALFFFLGPSPRAGQGDGWHFFSGSQQYRSSRIHHIWENSLTQPLLEGMEGTTESLEPAIHQSNPVLLYMPFTEIMHTSDDREEASSIGSIASYHGAVYYISPRKVLLLPTSSIPCPHGEYCFSDLGRSVTRICLLWIISFPIDFLRLA